jgi:hypothetical protein
MFIEMVSICFDLINNRMVVVAKKKSKQSIGSIEMKSSEQEEGISKNKGKM